MFSFFFVFFLTQTAGIHAPARSVVLVHDAPTFLTPTSLRQMTGRAGPKKRNSAFEKKTSAFLKKKCF
jgi:hypothetical protein